MLYYFFSLLFVFFLIFYILKNWYPNESSVFSYNYSVYNLITDIKNNNNSLLLFFINNKSSWGWIFIIYFFILKLIFFNFLTGSFFFILFIFKLYKLKKENKNFFFSLRRIFVSKDFFPSITNLFLTATFKISFSAAYYKLYNFLKFLYKKNEKVKKKDLIFIFIQRLTIFFLTFSFWHFFLAIDVYKTILENEYELEYIIEELLIKIFSDYNFFLKIVLLLKIYKIDDNLEFNPGKFNYMWSWYINFYNNFKQNNQEFDIKLGLIKSVNSYGDIENHYVLFNNSNNDLQHIGFFSRFFNNEQLNKYTILLIQNESLTLNDFNQYLNFNNVTKKINIEQKPISINKFETNCNIKTSEQKKFLYFTSLCLSGNLNFLNRIEGNNFFKLTAEEKNYYKLENYIYKKFIKECPYTYLNIKNSISYHASIYIINPTFFDENVHEA